MFQIFYKDDDNLRQLRNIQPGAWVNITAPSGAELEAISKLLDIPLSMLTDPLDEDERSRVEIEDDYLLILLRVPYFAGEEEVPFKTVPLGIIYGKNFIVTVGSRNPAIIQDFIQGRVKKSRIFRYVFKKLLHRAIICNITAAFAGYGKFFAESVGIFKYGNVGAEEHCRACRHHTGRTAANNANSLH